MSSPNLPEEEKRHSLRYRQGWSYWFEAIGNCILHINGSGIDPHSNSARRMPLSIVEQREWSAVEEWSRSADQTQLRGHTNERPNKVMHKLI